MYNTIYLFGTDPIPFLTLLMAIFFQMKNDTFSQAVFICKQILGSWDRLTVVPRFEVGHHGV